MRWKYPHFKEPERRPLHTVARSERLTKLLEHDPRYLEVPNFAAKLRDLSPAPLKIDIALSKLDNNKGLKQSHRKALIAAALSGFHEKDFADPTKRANYRKLREMQLKSREFTSRGGRQNVSGGDRRFYHPNRRRSAVNRYGVFAELMQNPVMSSSWIQVFKNPGSVIPCIQRRERREVLFAKGKGGRGYGGKRRRSWSSLIPC